MEITAKIISMIGSGTGGVKKWTCFNHWWLRVGHLNSVMYVISIRGSFDSIYTWKTLLFTLWFRVACGQLIKCKHLYMIVRVMYFTILSETEHSVSLQCSIQWPFWELAGLPWCKCWMWMWFKGKYRRIAGLISHQNHLAMEFDGSSHFTLCGNSLFNLIVASKRIMLRTNI